MGTTWKLEGLSLASAVRHITFKSFGGDAKVPCLAALFLKCELQNGVSGWVGIAGYELRQVNWAGRGKS